MSCDIGNTNLSLVIEPTQDLTIARVYVVFPDLDVFDSEVIGEYLFGGEMI